MRQRGPGVRLRRGLEGETNPINRVASVTNGWALVSLPQVPPCFGGPSQFCSTVSDLTDPSNAVNAVQIIAFSNLF